MRKTDYDMRDRCAEELYKLGNDARSISERSGFNPAVIQTWLNGDATPSAGSLARFHAIGLDVIYILTGGDRHV